MEETVITLIGQLGFPIFVAVYFMTQMNKHMQKTNELLTVLVERSEGEEK